MDNIPFDYLLKIIFIGDSTVGKSSLICRFTDDILTEEEGTTIGIDFRLKTIDVDNIRYKIQIWDTAGQERFKSLVGAFYRGAHGVMVVYDMTNIESFHNVKNWIKEVEYKCGEKMPLFCVIGNKYDLTEKIRITDDDIRELTSKYQCSHIKTSALHKKEISEAFNTMIKEMHDKNIVPNSIVKKEANLPLNINKNKNRRSCC